ncbi:helix-turn-helix transcriptional regulator [Clostridium botulinum]|nr:helix-turn-helix transcriptional regulator [Clostridium botulinum]
MSESKLRRCFKATYGKTIYEYIRYKKMEQAIRFLSHDEMSIHNISTTLGYESPSKFSAAFKKFMVLPLVHLENPLICNYD